MRAGAKLALKLHVHQCLNYEYDLHVRMCSCVLHAQVHAYVCFLPSDPSTYKLTKEIACYFNDCFVTVGAYTREKFASMFLKIANSVKSLFTHSGLQLSAMLARDRTACLSILPRQKHVRSGNHILWMLWIINSRACMLSKKKVAKIYGLY